MSHEVRLLQARGFSSRWSFRQRWGGRMTLNDDDADGLPGSGKNVQGCGWPLLDAGSGAACARPKGSEPGMALPCLSSCRLGQRRGLPSVPFPGHRDAKQLVERSDGEGHQLEAGRRRRRVRVAPPAVVRARPSPAKGEFAPRGSSEGSGVGVGDNIHLDSLPLSVGDGQFHVAPLESVRHLGRSLGPHGLPDELAGAGAGLPQDGRRVGSRLGQHRGQCLSLRLRLPGFVSSKNGTYRVHQRFPPTPQGECCFARSWLGEDSSRMLGRTGFWRGTGEARGSPGRARASSESNDLAVPKTVRIKLHTHRTPSTQDAAAHFPTDGVLGRHSRRGTASKPPPHWA